MVEYEKKMKKKLRKVWSVRKKGLILQSET